MSIGSQIIREYFVPFFSRIGELALKSVISDVSGDNHAIHILATEVFQCVFKRRCTFNIPDMDIADYADF